MANLGTKNGIFIARFRFMGKEHRRSLKTGNRKTVSKERETLVQFFEWAAARIYLTESPTKNLTPMIVSHRAESIH